MWRQLGERLSPARSRLPSGGALALSRYRARDRCRGQSLQVNGSASVSPGGHSPWMQQMPSDAGQGATKFRSGIGQLRPVLYRQTFCFPPLALVQQN